MRDGVRVSTRREEKSGDPAGRYAQDGEMRGSIQE
jgi:hypothetical protein